MQTDHHSRHGMLRRAEDTKNRIVAMVIPLLGFGILRAGEEDGRRRRTKKQQEALGFIKDGIGTVPEIVAAKVIHG